MRTTLSLDDDVSAAAQQLRDDRNIGLSEAVNELVRAGLRAPVSRTQFQQHSVELGLRVDVSDVGAALDELDGPTAR